jgi:hypothetical protein
LLPRGSSFKIISAEKDANGIVRVEAEYVGKGRMEKRYLTKAAKSKDESKSRFHWTADQFIIKKG